MIEKISPVRPDKCPPVIENSDQAADETSVITRPMPCTEMPCPEVVTERSGEGAAFHHIQWICRDVYHCPEAGVEV